MSNGIGQVHCRRRRGRMEVQGFGQTPRGQKYLKQTAELSAASPADPNFKRELASAVEEMLAQQAFELP